MSKHQDYVQKTEALVEPILQKHQFELVDVEFVKEAGSWHLRVYIDKEGGIAVDDCEVISRALSDWLDKEDFIDDSYILEVSSPGLLRPFKKPKDFMRNMGNEIEVHLYRAVDRQKQLVGLLKAYNADTITIENEDGSETDIDRVNVSLVRPTIDFSHSNAPPCRLTRRRAFGMRLFIR